MVSKLLPPTKEFDADSEAFQEYYRDLSPKKFELQNVDEDFVLKELKRLNSFKSTGVENIPFRFMKDGVDIIKLPVTYIVNLSIST